MISSDKGYLRQSPWNVPCASCGHPRSSHAVPGDSDYRKTLPNCYSGADPRAQCRCGEFVPADGPEAA